MSTGREHQTRFFMHYGDLTDATNLIRLVQEFQPDEIYNLAAQSHVRVRFETREYTANTDALGTLRLLGRCVYCGWKARHVLSGVHLRTLRQGPGRCRSVRRHRSTALTLCRGEAIRSLDGG
jgi:dTDP-D-glucose 4,6-dehydratase